MGYLYLVEQLLSGCYLIRTHHHQHLLVGEHTELGEDVEQRVACEEGGGEVLQVAQYLVLAVCPVAGKLE